ncbi:MAG: extradiol ring-cleavage dioxygenase [SAR202 cluster bacterium]|nr:extradiol ring-cleavage dioxygenase [SAR202 cluster bacterium]HCP24045.1 extradiol ring-cleavage dioxygenase [Dehalococcoidia bacterium]
MAEILGVGVTHSPSLITPDELKNYSLTRALRSNDRIPAERKVPASWPEAMQAEWGDDEGYTSAVTQREKLAEGFRKVRAELDAFNPDVVLVWGDDQYENFKEDIIPAFCILAYDGFECQPMVNGDGGQRPNIWNEPAEKVFRYKGHESARYLASALLEDGFDVAYSYKPLHEPGLGHAFLNTLLYLDYDRKGFDYPVIPFSVNCYGSSIIRNRGGAITQQKDGVDLPFDPPGPSPARCMEIGAATARAFANSPWKVALVASSSWSHAFLTPKNYWLYPDVESDLARFEELKAGDYEAWRNIPNSQIEDAGQQEILNWMCLAGALSELDRKPEIIEFVQTYIFNSSKCLAVMKP